MIYDKYVVHYENLKYYLSLGMKLVKMYRILKFKQSNWLKYYADFNTNLDKKVKTCLVKIYTNC